jgi:hypothetical protein
MVKDSLKIKIMEIELLLLLRKLIFYLIDYLNGQVFEKHIKFWRPVIELFQLVFGFKEGLRKLRIYKFRNDARQIETCVYLLQSETVNQADVYLLPARLRL